LKDVFAGQSEIAKAVAEQMKVKLLGERPQSDAAPSNQNLAAYNAVLQSDFYFQQLTPESLRRAIQFLEEAVRLDPNYAIAATLHGMACLLVPVCRCRVEGKRGTIHRV
jgi:adenylate cyclase